MGTNWAPRLCMQSLVMTMPSLGEEHSRLRSAVSKMESTVTCTWPRLRFDLKKDGVRQISLSKIHYYAWMKFSLALYPDKIYYYVLEKLIESVAWFIYQSCPFLTQNRSVISFVWSCSFGLEQVLAWASVLYADPFVCSRPG